MEVIALGVISYLLLDNNNNLTGGMFPFSRQQLLAQQIEQARQRQEAQRAAQRAADAQAARYRQLLAQQDQLAQQQILARQRQEAQQRAADAQADAEQDAIDADVATLPVLTTPTFTPTPLP